MVRPDVQSALQSSAWASSNQNSTALLCSMHAARTGSFHYRPYSDQLFAVLLAEVIEVTVCRCSLEQLLVTGL